MYISPGPRLSLLAHNDTHAICTKLGTRLDSHVGVTLDIKVTEKVKGHAVKYFTLKVGVVYVPAIPWTLTAGRKPAWACGTDMGMGRRAVLVYICCP